MATLILGSLGGTLGGALLGPVGALAGRALGAAGGAMLDGMLLGGGRRTQGPRLTDLGTMTSTEGAPLPRLYGRARLSGQVIWAAPVQEVVSTQTQSSGGKGGTLGGGSTSTTTYSYYGSFAVGLCEGPVSRIGRIWVDGRPLDRQGLNIRLHAGGEDQLPDPLIEAREGTAPAYRGLAYVVFERLPLADYGNRLPQVTVEVVRAVGELEGRIRAVTLIPGASEFGYDPREIRQVIRPGVYRPENRHVETADSDFDASLDELLAVCPNLESVALVVAWFGTDLRAGECRIEPGVERRDKTTRALLPVAWQVAGRTRADAYLVSAVEGRPAYGGTPSDDSVRRAILALKARGLKVTFYPFVMMDVPIGNALPDPWSGDTPPSYQPSYPWRGRITCHPAPERPGSPDGTALAGAEVAALFGTASAGDFGAAGTSVTYDGPEEWTLRRMVLHYARLVELAGGVEAFLIGSEMAALTRVRSAPGIYPAVGAFVELASEARALLRPETKIGYAADWTEYAGHVREGGAELRFPLDPLWASPDIDFIGIDWYAPIADWREGDAHLDAATHASTYERAYLAANVHGGEGFDWYYPDEAARNAQARVPITDGAHSEPWAFRSKDIAGWWGNAHHERAGGVRASAPTAWVPGSKPVRLTEIGCAAVDKGANRPSVFPDPKSVENGVPPFSNGRRDDLMQRRHLEASFDAFATDAANPPAAHPGGRMIDPAAIYAWSWDARPFPVFPLARDVWADGANWETGHWLTGRLGSAPLAELCARLAADFGVYLDASQLRGAIDGYVVDRPMTARAALEPLARAFGFDLMEAGGGLALRPRGGRIAATLTDEDIAGGEDVPAPGFTRAGEDELPRSVTLGFTDGANDYRRASAASRRLAGAARAETAFDIAMIADPGLVAGLAEMNLQDAWAGRESGRLALVPSALALALEPGDVVRLERDGRARLFEITAIEDREARTLSLRGIDPAVFDLAVRAGRTVPVSLPESFGPPELMLLALPNLTGSGAPVLAWLAAFAEPWPGAMALWRQLDGASFERTGTIAAPALTGTTLTALPPGAPWRWNRHAALEVELDGGLIAAASEEAVLGGANAVALVAPDGGVEVLQFAEAALTGARRWRLEALLRGQMGTEARARAGWPAGTRLVRLDRNLMPAATGLDLLGRSVTLRVGRADRDHGDAGVAEISGTVGAAALLPPAPVQARARRTPAGVAIRWIRRTRVDGDSWEAAEVPLGEQSEAYRVEVMNGAGVARGASVGASSFLYAAADEIADFGAAQPFLDVRIAQLSASAGPGAWLEARLAP